MTPIIKNRMRIPIDIFDRVPVMSHALMRLFSNEVMRAKSLNRDVFELYTQVQYYQTLTFLILDKV